MTFLLRRVLLDGGGHTECRLAEEFGPGIGARVAAARERLAAPGCPVPAVEARARYAWIRAATQGCVQRPVQRIVTWTDRLDRVLTHKVWGTVVFLLVMFLVFESIFFWAKPLMDLVGGGLKDLGDV